MMLDLAEDWFMMTSILEGGSDAIPYVFMKCAKSKESKGVARILGMTVCVKCAQGDEKKGDGGIARGEDSDAARELHEAW